MAARAGLVPGAVGRGRATDAGRSQSQPLGSGFARQDRASGARASLAGARPRPKRSRHPRPCSRAGAAVPRSREQSLQPGQKSVSSVLAASRPPLPRVAAWLLQLWPPQPGTCTLSWSLR